MPTREMAYTKPLEYFAMASSRASGLVGAARKIGARSTRSHLGQIFGGLFDDHVGGQHAIRAGCLGIIGKFRAGRSAKSDSNS